MKYLPIMLILAACGSADELRNSRASTDCMTTTMDACRDGDGKLWVQPEKAHLFDSYDYWIGQGG